MWPRQEKLLVMSFGVASFQENLVVCAVLKWA